MSGRDDDDEGSDEEWLPDPDEDVDSDGESGDASEAHASESSDDDDDAIPSVNMDAERSEMVAKLVMEDPCAAKCLAGREVALDNFCKSLDRMTKSERLVSAITSVGMLMQMETVDRRRGGGERNKFPFYLPLVGRVCREAYCAAYRVSPRSLMRYKKRIQSGVLSLADHGNVGNSNRKSVDVNWLVGWFRDFADEVGDRIAVRERTKELRDGRLVRSTTETVYTLLPPMFTWSRLHQEMLLKIEQSGVRRYEPAEATFRKILAKACPDIRIRSPQSNVCDICVIYHTNAARDISADKVEEQAKHAESARAMRLEYVADARRASDECVVLTIDFAQNLTLPNLANTPSQFYFMSLINLSLFGIYCASTSQHHHYLYSERVGSKGSNEVISMIHRHLKLSTAPAKKSLIIYADNCGGQNKNNFVIKYCLLLAHMGFFEEVSLKFFVKGHTKNACDRGFGHIKKLYVKTDCYTPEQVADVVTRASSSSITCSLEDEETPFFNFKPVVTEMYKNVKGLQKFQIFKASSEHPGRLECRETPTSPAVLFYLAKSYDGVLVTEDRALDLLDSMEPLARPEANPEKVYDVHKNISPFIPAEYKSHTLYAAPTDEQTEAARAKKKARTTKIASTGQSTVV